MGNNEMQWSEGQFKELTKFDEYRNGRDAVVPYTPPAHTPQPYKNTGEATAALIVAVGKPLVALTAVVGVVCVVGAAVIFAIGAVFTFVSTYALWVGGGVFAVACLVLAAFGSKGFGESKNESMPPPPNDGGKYEWYQEQRQGWRKM